MIDHARISSESLSQRLADSGLRATPQRELVYSSLLKVRDHPTAEEIFARVKAEMPTISLATVYNCLETLVQCRLIRQVNRERSSTRFCPNLHPHAHFHDDETGEIHDVELPLPVLDQLKKLLPENFYASSVEITFLGKIDQPVKAEPSSTATSRTIP